MENAFLGVPGVDAWLFAELSLAAFATTMFGVVVGTAGGLVLLGIMAFVFRQRCWFRFTLSSSSARARAAR
jgi:hypothetical protein